MQIECTGTYVGGTIQLTTPLNVPDNTTVQIIISSQLAEPTANPAYDKKRYAMLEFLEQSKKMAKSLQGHHYTRDELYDRY
jgi:hypothetical protein